MSRLQIAIQPGADFEVWRARYAPGNVATVMALAIKAALDRANPIATSRVNRARFTGNGPFPVGDHRLGHRSRRLTRSLTHSGARIVDAGGLKVASGIGSNVKYFGPHEFGFAGTVTVPAHERQMPEVQRVSSTGKSYVVPAHTQSVRSHSRRMRVPARAPLYTGLAEDATAEIYKRELYTELMDALSGTND